MKRIPGAAILMALLLSASSAAMADDDARALMLRLQKLLRSDTSIATYAMRVETPEWSRTIRFRAWDDRPGKRFFIRIFYPKRDEGTAWLKLGGSLWMYMPRLERDIRIPPSMMLSSWMGSDFTNDDLVKSASVVDDYRHRIISQDASRIVIESLPKPDAPVVWGKLVHVLRPDGIPVSEAFYDEHGRKRRLLRFEDVRMLGGRRIPARWVMQPLDQPGKRTVLQLERIEFDVPIPDRVFTRAHLKRWRPR